MGVYTHTHNPSNISPLLLFCTWLHVSASFMSTVHKTGVCISVFFASSQITICSTHVLYNITGRCTLNQYSALAAIYKYLFTRRTGTTLVKRRCGLLKLQPKFAAIFKQYRELCNKVVVIDEHLRHLLRNVCCIAKLVALYTLHILYTLYIQAI